MAFAADSSTEIAYRSIDNSDGVAVEKVRQVFRLRVMTREALGQSGLPFPGPPLRL